LETELNLDPDSNPDLESDPELITDPDPNLQINLDPVGSGCTTLATALNFCQRFVSNLALSSTPLMHVLFRISSRIRKPI
jgi:hypothetical protein